MKEKKTKNRRRRKRTNQMNKFKTMARERRVASITLISLCASILYLVVLVSNSIDLI